MMLMNDLRVAGANLKVVLLTFLNLNKLVRLDNIYAKYKKRYHFLDTKRFFCIILYYKMLTYCPYVIMHNLMRFNTVHNCLTAIALFLKCDIMFLTPVYHLLTFGMLLSNPDEYLAQVSQNVQNVKLSNCYHLVSTSINHSSAIA